MAAHAFRFSPRPNKADQIHWFPWGQAAFKQAQEQDKLVLLSISGVWCHWCHVMDETTYSDEEAIQLVNQRLIPIRVDTDQRPDVNERYNMGGWPTTVLLTPTGDIISGSTYVPPKEFRRWVNKINDLWAEHKAEILKEIEKGIRSERWTARPERMPDLDLITYQKVLRYIKAAYDRDYGGFGQEPKFPMTEALTLAQDAYLVSGDEMAYEMFAKSLKQMAGGGMYDKVEGGFFRYSTARDWSVPHFEKMLEDNVLLLDNLVAAYAISEDEEFRAIALDVLRYLEDNLYQPETGCWSGAHDADEEYYRLSMEQRNQRPSPYIDHNIYVDRNAWAVRSLVCAGVILEDEHWLKRGQESMEFLLAHCYDKQKGSAHFYLQKEAEMWGLLDDQTAMGAALSALYQATGEQRYLRISRHIAEQVMRRLTGPNGALFDAAPCPLAPGALARPLQGLDSNARACRWLAELSLLSGDDHYRSAAARCLRYWQGHYEEDGPLASGFAMAVADCTRSWSLIHVIGKLEHNETCRLRRAAHIYQNHQVAVHLLDPERDRPEVEKMSYSIDRPVAYICQGMQCLPPTDHAEIVIETVREHLKGQDQTIYAKPNY